jgi:hypothetical protein
VKAGRVFADGSCPCGCTVALRCVASEDEDSGLHSTLPPAPAPPNVDPLFGLETLIAQARDARAKGFPGVVKIRLSSAHRRIETALRALK